MANFVEGFAQLLWPLRRYPSAVAKASLLGLILLGVLDYGYKVHGIDLLWCRIKVATFDPLSVLMYIVSVKVSVILVLALVRCIRSVVIKKEIRGEDLPITCVRRRYCRFLMMQLLAAIDELVLEAEIMDLADYLQRHAAFATALQRFRCRARKMFERTDMQNLLPQHVVLPVDDRLEEELLGMGYAEGLGALREWEIYRLVYGPVG
ncbi:hypothetical protein KR054_003263 [Drosophila jambulina]|nr:hypothetical protein KR054_003263 [Drosophila jambulina]